MSSMTFLDHLRVTVATLQAKHPGKAGIIGRANAMIVDGMVVDNGDGTGKVLSSNLNTWYEVNGACECEAAEHGKRCKHLDGWWLYQKVKGQMAPWR